MRDKEARSMNAPLVFYSSSTSLQILHLRNPILNWRKPSPLFIAEREDSQGASQPVTRSQT
jgi:hypothetical protein